MALARHFNCTLIAAPSTPGPSRPPVAPEGPPRPLSIPPCHPLCRRAASRLRDLRLSPFSCVVLCTKSPPRCVLHLPARVFLSVPAVHRRRSLYTLTTPLLLYTPSPVRGSRAYVGNEGTGSAADTDTDRITGLVIFLTRLRRWRLVVTARRLYARCFFGGRCLASMGEFRWIAAMDDVT